MKIIDLKKRMKELDIQGTSNINSSNAKKVLKKVETYENINLADLKTRLKARGFKGISKITGSNKIEHVKMLIQLDKFSVRKPRSAAPARRNSRDFQREFEQCKEGLEKGRGL